MKYILKSIKEYSNLPKVIEVMFFASVIALPSNLSKTWQPEWSYYQGIFIEHWAPKIFLSQMLLLGLFLLILWEKRDLLAKKNLIQAFFRTNPSKAKNRLFFEKKHLLIIFSLVFFVGRSLFSPDWERSAVWFWGILTGPLLLSLCLWHKDVREKLPQAILLSSSLQAALGIYQFFFQKSLFSYYVLGETSFISPLHLAKSSFLPFVHILPYGSTPHPNILAAWLLLGITSLIMIKKNVHKRLFIPLLSLHFFALVLTESLSAWATLPYLFIIFLWNAKKEMSPRRLLIFLVINALFWTTLPIFLAHTWQGGNIPTSILRRSAPLERLSLSKKDLLIGLGVNKSFPYLNSSESETQLWKFPQPLHHSGIIAIAELGFGVILLLFIYYIIESRNYSFFRGIFPFLLPILYLDHYVLTHSIGQCMCIVLLYFLHNNHNKISPGELKKQKAK